MLEEYEYSELSRKRVYGLLLFLVLLGGLAILIAFRTTTGIKGVFAARDNQAPTELNLSDGEANEPVTEANEPDSEPNEPSEPKPVEPNDPNLSRPLRPAHKHPAFTQRVAERARMVDWQIEGRGIKDPNVLMAMRIVPRHAFVPETQERYASADRPLPIGQDQTISPPYRVACMTDA
jgi:hypothetical protein